MQSRVVEAITSAEPSVESPRLSSAELSSAELTGDKPSDEPSGDLMTPSSAKPSDEPSITKVIAEF